MGEKYELPPYSPGVVLPTAVLRDRPPLLGIRGWPWERCGFLSPLPPVADRERKLVLDALRLMLKEEWDGLLPT